MIRPRDPRVRQTLNQLSHSLEAANESAQDSLATLSHNYVAPCLSDIQTGLKSCFGVCADVGVCPGVCFTREELLRRRRRRRWSGRVESNFGFYDDWDYDADDHPGDLLGWHHDELDRLLAGSSNSAGDRGAGPSIAIPEQPRRDRQRRMSYGTRWKKTATAADIAERRAQQSDPTVIPSSSLLGFLEWLPAWWRPSARGIKYHPSAADLQEHPGRSGSGDAQNEYEAQPLIAEESEDSDEGYLDHGHAGGSSTAAFRNHDNEDECHHNRYSDRSPSPNARRTRSSTQSSHDTATNSLSSRGDLLPSDEEDAVPLDDEFASTLVRRDTTASGTPTTTTTGAGTGAEDPASTSGRRSGSGTSIASESMKSRENKERDKNKRRRRRSNKSDKNNSGNNVTTSPASDAKLGADVALDGLENISTVHAADTTDTSRIPSMLSLNDLHSEEEAARVLEEREIVRKRRAAAALARKRGLSVSGLENGKVDEDSEEDFDEVGSYTYWKLLTMY